MYTPVNKFYYIKVGSKGSNLLGGLLSPSIAMVFDLILGTALGISIQIILRA